MRRPLLSACVAALFAAACQEPRSAPAKVGRAATPAAPAVAAQALPDAGVLMTEHLVEPEPVGLAHSDSAPADHVERAKDFLLEGDPASALIEARRAAFDHPTDDEAMYLLARIARMKGERELAALALGKLATLRPDDPVPLTEQGRLFIRLGAFDAAALSAVAALERDPQSAEAHHVLGRAYLSLGDLQRAIPELEEAVDLDPDHGYALNNLGFAYLRANENDRAVEVLEVAKSLLPGVAYVVNNLGVALERVGRLEDAKRAYWRASDLSPKYVKAKLNSARLARVHLDPSDAELETAEPLTTSED